MLALAVALAHAVYLFAIGVTTPNPLHQQLISGPGRGRCAASGRFGQDEEGSLAGASAHVGGRNLDLCVSWLATLDPLAC